MWNSHMLLADSALFHIYYCCFVDESEKLIINIILRQLIPSLAAILLWMKMSTIICTSIHVHFIHFHM